MAATAPVRQSSATGGVWPWRRKPSKFGLVSINEAYMSDLHKPKLPRPENGQRHTGANKP